MNFMVSTTKSQNMKKYLSGFMIALFLMMAGHSVYAQKAAGGSDYTNALGLGIDFGDGQTLVGISGKDFFTANHVGEADVLCGDRYTIIQALYEYHKQIENAEGLKWYAGIGPGFGLGKGYSTFLIRPIGGLDYKLRNVPLNFSFDWRPILQFDKGDSDFAAARFGLGFRFAFN